ncbi:MAG: hypothetical protein HUU50_12465 [Candidatus Brocadiae bacterium]|nr:hypothetical protein [Candidatus Brocadiia bacterium]
MEGKIDIKIEGDHLTEVAGIHIEHVDHLVLKPGDVAANENNEGKLVVTGTHTNQLIRKVVKLFCFLYFLMRAHTNVKTLISLFVLFTFTSFLYFLMGAHTNHIKNDNYNLKFDYNTHAWCIEAGFQMGRMEFIFKNQRFDPIMNELLLKTQNEIINEMALNHFGWMIYPREPQVCRRRTLKCSKDS